MGGGSASLWVHMGHTEQVVMEIGHIEQGGVEMGRTEQSVVEIEHTEQGGVEMGHTEQGVSVQDGGRGENSPRQCGEDQSKALFPGTVWGEGLGRAQPVGSG